MFPDGLCQHLWVRFGSILVHHQNLITEKWLTGDLASYKTFLKDLGAEMTLFSIQNPDLLQQPSPSLSSLQLWICFQPQHKLLIPIPTWPFLNATTSHTPIPSTGSRTSTILSFLPNLYSPLHRAPISSLVSVPAIVPATARASMCDWHINNQACPPPRQIQMHLSKWWSTRPQGSIVYIFTPLFTKVRF